jgi:hypothetical protein
MMPYMCRGTVYSLSTSLLSISNIERMSRKKDWENPQNMSTRSDRRKSPYDLADIYHEDVKVRRLYLKDFPGDSIKTCLGCMALLKRHKVLRAFMSKFRKSQNFLVEKSSVI